MQKIQFYLVSNRITVTTDLVSSGYNTEFRQVYQRKIKLYKGIDNTIELDVRNSEQRKETVFGYTVVLKFFDARHKNLFSVEGTPILSKPGLMSVTISKEQLATISPQKLKVAAYLREGATERILYVDAQFDLFGNVELFDGYNEKLGFGDIIQEVTVFNFEHDKEGFTSDLIEFGTDLNDDYSTTTKSVTVDIVVNQASPFTGNMTVQATKQVSTSVGNVWTDIATISIAGQDVSQVIENADSYTYFRLFYPKYNEDKSLTGTVDKAIVRN